MNGSNKNLYIFLGTKQVATLSFKEELLSWQYTKEWQKDGFALSPNLPLDNMISNINIKIFLRNLLPEGQGLDEILMQFNLSSTNTFALIIALGQDLSGAMVIKQNKSILDQEPLFTKITSKELINKLDQRKQHGLIMWHDKPRLSVAGVQDKINLLINSQGDFGFGDGSLCSSHILKFEKKTTINLALNEFISMKLAHLCEINVADCQLVRLAKHTALLVKRFDRKLINNELVKRRHLIDGCQALNLPPEYKYERNFGSGRDVKHIRDGASLIKLFNFAKLCKNPAQTTLQLIDWLIFNCLIFNFDAHGKNLSFFISQKGIELTPFYDLVNIKMYPKFEQDLAMALGDEFDGNALNAYQFADFADSCNIKRSIVIKRLNKLSTTIIDCDFMSFKKYCKNKSEEKFIDKYSLLVKKRAEHFLNQTKLIKTIDL